MRDHEHAFLATLPDPVTLYRGVQPVRPPSGKKVYRGLAWTNDPNTALKFARRGGRTDGTLLMASVRKDCILACFLSRAEDEVVIDPRNVRQIECTPAELRQIQPKFNA